MNKWKNAGKVAVDSGQLLITDPCYLKEFTNDEYDSEEELRRGEPTAYSYSGCCNATVSNHQCGQTPQGTLKEAGFALSTGYGDGIYPVFIKRNAEGRIIAVMVTFT